MIGLVLVGMVGCLGTLQVEDLSPVSQPPVSPLPSVPLASPHLEVQPSFLLWDVEVGCADAFVTDLWVEIRSSDTLTTQVLHGSCATRLSFDVDVRIDAEVQIRTYATAADALRIDVPGAANFATDWIEVGDLKAGERVELTETLVCVDCDSPLLTPIIVTPTFQNYDGLGGCEVNPSGWLWAEVRSGSDGRSQVFAEPCSQPTTFFIEPFPDAYLQVRNDELAAIPWFDTLPAFEAPEPWPLVVYTTDWLPLGLVAIDQPILVDAVLRCIEVGADDACGGA